MNNIFYLTKIKIETFLKRNNTNYYKLHNLLQVFYKFFQVLLKLIMSWVYNPFNVLLILIGRCVGFNPLQKPGRSYNEVPKYNKNSKI